MKGVPAFFMLLLCKISPGQGGLEAPPLYSSLKLKKQAGFLAVLFTLLQLNLKSQDQTICAGNTGTISTPFPISGATYTLQPGGATSQTGTFIVSPTVTTTYTLYMNSSFGNFSAVSTVTALPQPLAAPTVTQMSCISATAAFNLNLTFLPSSPTPQYWINWGSMVPAGYTNPQTSGSGSIAAGVYTAAIMTTEGCSTSATFTIDPSPTPTIVIQGPPVFCSGMNASLTASGASSYTWSTGANTSSIFAAPTVPTVYSLAGTGTTNCTTTVNYTIVPDQSSAFSYTVSGMVATLLLTSSTCNSFEFNISNGTTVTANPNPVISFTTPGVYSVCLRCPALPLSCVRCLNLKVPGNGMGAVGIDEEAALQNIQFFPNPSAHIFQIQNFQGVAGRLLVYDLWGKKIIDRDLGSSDQLSLEVKGVYTYRVVNEYGLKQSGKLVVQ